ncbi:class I mannose-6-phosphate isomerase [bacterium]|nr:class I mannose-6-phosphate isomerase [Akkermansiaceae bacterium]MDA7896552.1 class I mannose-6-phosphate isomerase [bacterium]MDB4369979.1 class I mannose-6-phosphate isomerase [Akkermansiaceae bacterium]MDB4809151.1 class I mannose-6-phosphate isomerase [bacterium]
MTRVWGGRSLETVYQRDLPDDQPYGESWEMSDRAGEQSIVSSGPFAGKSLHDLWTNHREEIFGDDLTGDRFPLLIKILDARDDLSIQVHPPAEVADELGGDPKTEMWYIADCDPGAKLYIGLKDGCTRDTFERSLAEGTVEEQVHAVSPRAGESIFIPSGRLHAIGAGFLIYEIQQNSDTTYRVFDWNRVGLDGAPRDLHIEESMASIDFDDFEPGMDQPDGDTLASCEYFVVTRHNIPESQEITIQNDAFSIITVISGEIRSDAGTIFKTGDFLILPRNAHPLIAQTDCQVLRTRLPGN